MASSNTPDGAGRDDEAGLGHDGDRAGRPEDRSGDAARDQSGAPGDGDHHSRPGELEDAEVEAQWEDIVARLEAPEAPGAPGAT
ncbi:hypothetical protein, partial [Puerhibacterium puerhi]|uniref:hypothetical protein n=1 Tax=Puerhibacterium puerhi TaxID=2692623 RepID=UPI00135B587C